MSKRTNLCVLYGGNSGEHDVSRRSAASVVRHLDPSRYALTVIGIDRSGVWHLQRSISIETLAGGDEALRIVPSSESLSIVPMQGLHCNSVRLELDCVFPVLHGAFGEDGKLQGALEIADLPYVGAGVLGSSASMDKAVAKALWRDAGLPVVDFIVADAKSTPAELSAVAARFGWPLFVKPCCGGSSLGASRANNMPELQTALADALRFDLRALIEPCLNVRELECSVIGDLEITVFPPGEVTPSQNHEFYDYAAKYSDPCGAQLQTVADLDPATRRRISEIAAAAYTAVRCEGMGRVDFFLERSSGSIYLNEINTIPGFTSISMYPRMCQAGGLDYPRLLDRLIDLACQRATATAARP